MVSLVTLAIIEAAAVARLRWSPFIRGVWGITVAIG
jgi:hypothetical protein